MLITRDCNYIVIVCLKMSLQKKCCLFVVSNASEQVTQLRENHHCKRLVIGKPCSQGSCCPKLELTPSIVGPHAMGLGSSYLCQHLWVQYTFVTWGLTFISFWSLEFHTKQLSASCLQNTSKWSHT